MVSKAFLDKFVSGDPIDNKLALDWVMASHKTKEIFIWTDDDPVHWCANASPGFNVLSYRKTSKSHLSKQ